jgi:hypothetical protein
MEFSKRTMQKLLSYVNIVLIEIKIISMKKCCSLFRLCSDKDTINDYIMVILFFDIKCTVNEYKNKVHSVIKHIITIS